MDFVIVPQSHTIYACDILAVSSFDSDLVQSPSIGTFIIDSLAISIPFLSLYQSQWHFGVVNSLVLIILFSVT
jgi:hypothetical protein